MFYAGEEHDYREGDNHKVDTTQCDEGRVKCHRRNVVTCLKVYRGKLINNNIYINVTTSWTASWMVMYCMWNLSKYFVYEQIRPYLLNIIKCCLIREIKYNKIKI